MFLKVQSFFSEILAAFSGKVSGATRTVTGWLKTLERNNIFSLKRKVINSSLFPKMFFNSEYSEKSKNKIFKNWKMYYMNFQALQGCEMKLKCGA